MGRIVAAVVGLMALVAIVMIALFIADLVPSRVRRAVLIAVGFLIVLAWLPVTSSVVIFLVIWIALWGSAGKAICVRKNCPTLGFWLGAILGPLGILIACLVPYIPPAPKRVQR
jgi:MFS family permease